MDAEIRTARCFAGVHAHQQDNAIGQHTKLQCDADRMVCDDVCIANSIFRAADDVCAFLQAAFASIGLNDICTHLS